MWLRATLGTGYLKFLCPQNTNKASGPITVGEKAWEKDSSLPLNSLTQRKAADVSVLKHVSGLSKVGEKMKVKREQREAGDCFYGVYFSPARECLTETGSLPA